MVMLTARGEEEDACAGWKPALTITLPSRFPQGGWWRALKAVMRRISPMAVER
ncbi:hypothetical protein KCP70_18140 [Salmonella enterica subsp. enterica]|nr:hypothetical protein KCP70_18140 [Salmonella enterica subsp. enterica]